MCFNQLIADLTTANSITATFINNYDHTMYVKARHITQEHLKKNEDGSVDWLPLGAPETRDHSSLVYYPYYMTANNFSDEIKRLR